MLTENAISKLTIKGFKSIRELVDFELRDLNVIVGANGAGKELSTFFCHGVRPHGRRKVVYD